MVDFHRPGHICIFSLTLLPSSIRQSGSQTLSQLHNYRTLYKKHVTEMSTHIKRARKRGQEVAELKKSGEISALQYELGAKNK